MRAVAIAFFFMLLFSSVSFAWLDGYSYVATVNLNSTVESTLYDFPAYFVLDTEALIDQGTIQSDCDDIRPTDTSDNTLSYEIENCDAVNTVVWVKIPALTSGLYPIRVYVGNTGASDGQDVSGTWSNNFTSVWHFDDDLTDSLATNNLASTGTINYYNNSYCARGTCVHSTDSLNKNSATHPTGTNPSTMSAFLYKDNSDNPSYFFFAGNWAMNQARGAYYWSSHSGVKMYAVDSSKGAVVTTSEAPLHSVTYYAGIMNSTSFAMFMNATKANSNDIGSASTVAGSVTFGSVAGDTGGGNFYYDEARLATVTRSDDWLKAEYLQTYTTGEFLTLAVSLDNANETENKTMTIDLNVGSITEYSINVWYNNTLVLNETDTGTWNSYEWNVSVVAPLVDENNTLIPYEVYVNYTAGSSYEESDLGNQSVDLWYYNDSYTYTWGYSVEAANTITITPPTKPDSAPANVTYDSHSYTSDYCLKWYANGSSSSYDCSSYVTDNSLTSVTFSPTHLKEDGVIYEDYHVNRSWTISFDATTESTSSKTFSDSAQNMSRDYFVWLVNYTNGSINGASNLSTTFYTVFLHETSLASLNVDSATATYYVYFSDGTNKNFSVEYNGSDAVTNSTVRGYPDFYATANISSEEVYSKENYTTRSRFLQFATVNLSEQHDVNIYMLPLSSSSYGIIYVHDAGDAVSGAYVQVLKYYAGSGQYLNIEQKITNNDGKAPVYLQMDAYYKFYVYDSSGGVLYQSSSPEQFICDTTCEIEINIDTSAASDFITPYAVADCYGNETANSIIYSYVDATGLTSNISYLAFRGSSVVCNSSDSASSGSYVCSLSSPENLSSYLYVCEVRSSASPEFTYYTGMIDFRDITIINDWIVVGIVCVLSIAVAFVHPALGVGVLCIALVGFSLLGFIDMSEGAAVMILAVGGVIAYLLLKEGG